MAEFAEAQPSSLLSVQDSPQSHNASHQTSEDQKESGKKGKFGSRFLTNPQNVFQHNAWDNVVWDEEQELEARSITETHSSHLMPGDKKEELEKDADSFWDKFYSQHQNRFFKDRHWLFTEFPELYEGKAVSKTSCDGPETFEASGINGLKLQDTNECNHDELSTDSVSKDFHCTETKRVECAEDIPKEIETAAHNDSSQNVSSLRFLEVGCGVGNTVFPVLNTNKNPGLMVYCCDFSNTAVQILKEHPDYDEKRCNAFVWDITQDNPDLPVEKESLDIIIMIFVLSALCPDKMQGAVNRLASLLKPGGTLLFRDYGRYDMAQLRFKKGRCISENFYVRGDGTRVYFFTQEELDELFKKAGLNKKENLVDRRLQVNRGKQLKMYRVWIQCKYVKDGTCN